MSRKTRSDITPAEIREAATRVLERRPEVPAEQQPARVEATPEVTVYEG
jgi:hypothetical protein